ncbi:hypothetical protein FOPG_08025 [Fusarium oxysporum f. sp. conglutinans race 2 54008]|uniref:Uncharacterized protein n=2 Tax=Fusarium oxysporum TaxID=5507 RepID=X0HLW9_FUSOX|nr:hypothetical protein FOVG_04292 [Fusarium oxysporum f. sp. pisi HDV247]EXL77457.1 hypothetical protein FOPG_08025 [Fusarium oxysporum f. sp. conglutinans race 2 54008]
MGMYNGQEEHDNLVWDKKDEVFEATATATIKDLLSQS